MVLYGLWAVFFFAVRQMIAVERDQDRNQRQHLTEHAGVRADEEVIKQPRRACQKDEQAHNEQIFVAVGRRGNKLGKDQVII